RYFGSAGAWGVSRGCRLVLRGFGTAGVCTSGLRTSELRWSVVCTSGLCSSARRGRGGGATAGAPSIPDRDPRFGLTPVSSPSGVLVQAGVPPARAGCHRAQDATSGHPGRRL